MATSLASSHNSEFIPSDRMQAAFERACAGKDRYESESAADAALGFLKRGTIRHPRSGGRWDTLNSYQCAFCEKWHHGHP